LVLDGHDVTSTSPHRRAVGLVFQDHALFHHRDVFGNVAFGLRMRGDPAASIEKRVRELLHLVGLSGFEKRSIATLSGGEQQRVALARALAPEPRVLLLDEPLGSLDRRLRDRLLEDLGRLFDELRVTAVYVTHDQAEAFALGDRVAVMRDGRIAQDGSPDELWSHPVDEDVARFLGSRNVIGGEIVRPEAVTVRPAAGAGYGVVESATRHGPTVRLVLRLDDGSTLEAAVAALEHPVPGDRVDVEVDPKGIVRLP
jgi:thiamine transport system ATP-binding protein